MDTLEQAQAGAGQAVLLSGEPGIGKSRLTSEMRTQVEYHDHAVPLTFQCSPYAQNSAFYPIINRLSQSDSTTIFVNSSTNSGIPSVLLATSAMRAGGSGLPPVTVVTIASICAWPKRPKVNCVICDRTGQGGLNSGR